MANWRTQELTLVSDKNVRNELEAAPIPPLTSIVSESLRTRDGTNSISLDGFTYWHRQSFDIDHVLYWAICGEGNRGDNLVLAGELAQKKKARNASNSTFYIKRAIKGGDVPEAVCRRDHTSETFPVALLRNGRGPLQDVHLSEIGQNQIEHAVQHYRQILNHLHHQDALPPKKVGEYVYRTNGTMKITVKPYVIKSKRPDIEGALGNSQYEAVASWLIRDAQLRGAWVAYVVEYLVHNLRKFAASAKSTNPLSGLSERDVVNILKQMIAVYDIRRVARPPKLLLEPTDNLVRTIYRTQQNRGNIVKGTNFYT